MVSKKLLITVASLFAIAATTLTGCSSIPMRGGDEWKALFYTEKPMLGEELTVESGIVNDEGWYATLIDDFNGNELDPEIWEPIAHGKRNSEYWCPQMLSVVDGRAIIKAEKLTDHQCEVCPMSGNFTAGMHTKQNFEQAYGYFEARIRVPRVSGVWSTMTVQSPMASSTGNGGRDGAKIDIFESAFYNGNNAEVGHAVHYDTKARRDSYIQRISETKGNLYLDYNTYSLLWTPKSYVFYVNGEATWGTDFGGVSSVNAYISIANEIIGDNIPPFEQKMSPFSTTGAAEIDYVKVYQNNKYKKVY